jgi:hypothetical protein
MRLYDILKEYGIPANEARTRLKNNQIKVNGEPQGADYEVGNVTDVYDQGFFIGIIPNYKLNSKRIMIFGLENLMSGESNIEDDLTSFLKDFKMIQISKDTIIFAKTTDKEPTSDLVNIVWHREGKGKMSSEFELPKKVDNNDKINKLKSDLAKVEKQLSNPGFVKNAPEFKLNQAKSRMQNIKDKLSELGVNESKVLSFEDFKNK